MSKQNEYFPQSRPHPGETLKEWLVQEGMSTREFAELTGISKAIIRGIVKGERNLSTALAIIFGVWTNIPIHFWMNAQKNYNEYLTERKAHERLHQEIPPTCVLEQDT